MSKQNNLTEDLSSSVSIDVLVVIDTEYVKEHYPNPSTDPGNPTGINHSSQFMIASDPRGIVSGQGTADLNFRANTGDFVSFRGTSIYQNSDDAIIIYGIRYWSGDKVFGRFTPNLITRSGAVIPDPGSENGLPANHIALSFSSLDSRVSKRGTENFYVDFALYTLSENGEDQELLGYYYWDPTISVAQ